jgi:hypothetical protein
MPRKRETLYCSFCKSEMDERYPECPECRQYVPEPIPESVMEQEEDIEYLS